jgi:hypothetical protein
MDIPCSDVNDSCICSEQPLVCGTMLCRYYDYGCPTEMTCECGDGWGNPCPASGGTGGAIGAGGSGGGGVIADAGDGGG